MRYFIDTANIDQIKEAKDLGILDGVTTNPSLMAKEGITGLDNILRHYKKISDIVGENGDVSAEVISTSYAGMINEGQRFADLAPNIVVKVPIIREGVKAINWFSEREIKTNCTLIFSPGQAMLAARAGASYISPFIGRIDDITWDGIALIKEISEIFNNIFTETEILAASIRSPLHIVQAAKAGADIVTCPLSAIYGMLNHPLTESGLKKFIEDHERASAKA